MRLRDYIVRHSAPGEPLGKTNSVIRKLALQSGVTALTLYRVSIDSRKTTRLNARAISKSTGGRVPPTGLFNANPKKPGPKRREATA